MVSTSLSTCNNQSYLTSYGHTSLNESSRHEESRLEVMNSESERRLVLINSELRKLTRGIWETNGSSIFACLLCCLNFYTLSRFSILAYYLKGKQMF